MIDSDNIEFKTIGKPDDDDDAMMTTVVMMIIFSAYADHRELPDIKIFLRAKLIME